MVSVKHSTLKRCSWRRKRRDFGPRVARWWNMAQVVSVGQDFSGALGWKIVR